MSYNVLVLGSGGREHAFVWSLIKDSQIDKIFCAPGNGGTEDIAINVLLDINKPIDVLEFVVDNDIDLTIVGPEAPLEKGIVDLFKKNNKLIFGPTKYASQLESSKLFAREVLHDCNVKQPKFFSCKTKEDVLMVKEEIGLPFVIKVDGLAAGKGVYVCLKEEDYYKAIDNIFNKNMFGKSSDIILIEECLFGEELSVFAICDGRDFKILNTAQDHKRIYDNDKGPNTGGMGAYSPTPLSTENLIKKVENEIYKPVLDYMYSQGNPFTGFLYAGLMLVDNEPYVIEFNVRMGDPETQVVLPLLETSLFDILYKTTNNELNSIDIKISSKTALTVVLASEGYPEEYTKGQKIILKNKSLLFHAGTKLIEGDLCVNGGRVLNVVGVGKNLKEAKENVYKDIENIEFDKKYFRNDIGDKGIRYNQANLEKE